MWRRERDSNPRAIARKLISSQPRYDHFDISPYSVVFEFCTAFARPMLKCVHSKFKKNEAFARYCEKTRAFASCRVMSSATFRVSPVMSCQRARNFSLACRFAKFRPLPLLFAPFIRHRRRSQTSPLRYRSVFGCV